MSRALKILIVDDEPLIRRSLSLAGQSREHITKEAENGQTALELWPVFQPDLAFIDILMPKMNGFELLKKIPETSKTKIIIISAHDDLREKDIKQKGVDLFIQKPFENIFKLIEKAEKLMTDSV